MERFFRIERCLNGYLIVIVRPGSHSDHKDTYAAESVNSVLVILEKLLDGGAAHV